MGLRYAAFDHASGEPVGLREYLPAGVAARREGADVEAELGTDFDLGLAGFLANAVRLARVDHPNVARARGHVRANGTAYLVTDTLPETTLAGRLDPGRTLSAAALFLIGLSRTFTIVVGLQILLSFALAAIFLGESATWSDGLGAVLIALGVYAVALYGQPGTGVPSPLDQLRHLASAIRGASLAPPTFAPIRAVVLAPPPAFPILGVAPPSAPGIRHRVWRLLLAHRLVLGISVAFLTALSFSVASVMLRDASIDVDPAAATLPRMPLILAFLAPLVLLWPRSHVRRRDVSKRSLVVLLLAGVVGSGAAALLFIPAVQDLGAGGAVAVISTSPLFGLPLAVIFLHERITRWAVIGTVVALAGIVLLA